MCLLIFLIQSDLFRTKLSTAQMLIDISGSLGTIFYMWLCAHVLNVVCMSNDYHLFNVFLGYFLLTINACF